ncbi:unnamed protein product [Periconia digitata]|uniref:Transmembrane protein n=1 Tax=Periconia digitata TaxID=1303443 RepID=A0A9W4UHC3_9PLEO|nr:unnamed protein product [Periconia digitata]
MSRPPSAAHNPLSPYNHHHQLHSQSSSPTLLTTNLLFPETDSSSTRTRDLSSPPSPTASIESFDILDSIAWRRGHDHYSHHNSRGSRRTCNVFGRRWSRAHVIAVLLFFALFLVGCVVGGWAAARWEKDGRVRKECVRRGGGGERCWGKGEWAWAQCVAGNGVGFCEGML